MRGPSRLPGPPSTGARDRRRVRISDLGVGLLGQALARRSGKSYEALVKERVLTPPRMDHSGITLTPWMSEHRAKGHDATGALRHRPG
ncbi:MAG: serine hydrolase, partial [Vicinamibacterales bacterium]